MIVNISKTKYIHFSGKDFDFETEVVFIKKAAITDTVVTVKFWKK